MSFDDKYNHGLNKTNWHVLNKMRLCRSCGLNHDQNNHNTKSIIGEKTQRDKHTRIWRIFYDGELNNRQYTLITSQWPCTEEVWLFALTLLSVVTIAMRRYQINSRTIMQKIQGCLAHGILWVVVTFLCYLDMVGWLLNDRAHDFEAEWSRTGI